MKGREAERGAALVEYAVGAAILFAILIVGAGVLAKFNVTVAAYSEVSELDEARAVLADLVKNDFDGAGRNLTRGEPPTFGTEPLQIESDADWRVNSAAADGTTATRLRFGNWQVKEAGRGLASGNGSVTFKPVEHGTSVGLSGADGARRMIITQADWLTPSIIINEGTPTRNFFVASDSPFYGPAHVPPHRSGDRYRVAVENGDTGRVVRYYRTRGGAESLIYTSTAPVPPYPIRPAISLYNTGSIEEMRLYGGPIMALNNGAMQLAPLPLDRGQRLTGPVTIIGGTVTILSGDPETDIVYNSAPFTGVGTGDLTPLRPPRRGSFDAGDYAMVIDFWANRAGLYRVEARDPSSGRMSLRLVREPEAAWGRLWSDDADPLPSFPAGSTVVKLSPPVTYSVSNDGRLVRMEGDRPATAAFAVRSASCTDQSTAGAKSYALTVTIAAEGFQTDQSASNEPRSTFEYTSTPPALNLFNNQLNSTR